MPRHWAGSRRSYGASPGKSGAVADGPRRWLTAPCRVRSSRQPTPEAPCRARARPRARGWCRRGVARRRSGSQELVVRDAVQHVGVHTTSQALQALRCLADCPPEPHASTPSRRLSTDYGKRCRRASRSMHRYSMHRPAAMDGRRPPRRLSTLDLPDVNGARQVNIVEPLLQLMSPQPVLLMLA